MKFGLKKLKTNQVLIGVAIVLIVLYLMRILPVRLERYEEAANEEAAAGEPVPDKVAEAAVEGATEKGMSQAELDAVLKFIQ